MGKKIILEGKVGRKARFGYGVCWDLKNPIEGKKYAIVNTWTDGSHKVYPWNEGDCFSVEVDYVVGPEALLIAKVL